MIHFVFTLDYEIYGNGEGALEPLVYTPTARLAELFSKYEAPFVNFVEVAELERIEEAGTDQAITKVREQVRALQNVGCESALHLHPQWYNATRSQGRWQLDLSEYNLCLLPEERIAEIVDRGIAYMRYLVGDAAFTPTSFRAGNWLFQPTGRAGAVLATRGVRVDSSVFKGGVQRRHGLDYRPARKNGHFWRFRDDVNRAEPDGPMLEVPIHTDMVPAWKMLKARRMAAGNALGAQGSGVADRISRIGDFLRPLYPRKLDFCRLDAQDAISMIEPIVQEDRVDPEKLRPVVAIGHSKDNPDVREIEELLRWLRANGIAITTLHELLPKLDRVSDGGDDTSVTRR